MGPLHSISGRPLARPLAWRAALMATALAAAPATHAQSLPSVVLEQLEISEGLAGFGGDLDPIDAFGYAVETLGDLDGDGVPDLAVGTNLDDDGGNFTGAVWILFLNPDGTVKAEQKISALAGGFGGTLLPGDRFGSGVASLGDLDGDGVIDLAVGTSFADTFGFSSGAIWILLLNADGTVKSELEISGNTPALVGLIPFNARFGRSLEALGDLNGDGVTELAVGAWKDAGGATLVLFLDSAGSVQSATKIAAGQSGLDADVAVNFGTGIAALGDLDGDGVRDMAVGANGADDWRGEVWVLFLNSDGTVKQHQRIAQDSGGFGGALDPDDLFGTSLGTLPDRDGDGAPELVVGAVWDDDGSANAGAAWILALEPDGRVDSWQKISETSGGFSGGLTSSEFFGGGLAAIDTDADGQFSLAVGAGNDNDFIGAPETGSVWVLSLNPALWREHGLELAGAGGPPRLAGSGALTANAPTRLELSGAGAGLTAAFVLGLSALEVPFKGGAMFPFPDSISSLMLTDGLGQLSLDGAWPAGVPAGVSFFSQVWVVDPTGPFGLSASNGVSGRTP